MLSAVVLLAAVLSSAFAHNFLISNDDGWATAQARAQFDSFANAGFNVRAPSPILLPFCFDLIFLKPILAAPANTESSTGTESTTPVPLQTPCQFDTCPVGSPAIGFDPDNCVYNRVNVKRTPPHSDHAAVTQRKSLM